jgi:hypothetical protein
VCNVFLLPVLHWTVFVVLLQSLLSTARLAGPRRHPLQRWPVPYSIDESVGGLRLNVVDGKPNKGPMRQLFDGRGELMQCLATRLHPGLKVWSVSRRQLMVSESVSQRPNDVLVQCFVTQQELLRYYGNAVGCIGHATKETPNMSLYIWFLFTCQLNLSEKCIIRSWVACSKSP